MHMSYSFNPSIQLPGFANDAHVDTFLWWLRVIFKVLSFLFCICSFLFHSIYPMIQLSFPSLFFSFHSLNLFQKMRRKKKIFLLKKKKKKRTFKFEHRTRERVGLDGDGTRYGESATPFYVNTLMIHRFLKKDRKSVV